HWHHAQQDLLVVRERFAQQEKRTSQVREQFENLDSILRKKQEEIRELRMTLSGMHNRAAEIHKRIEQLTRENAILDERKNSALSQIRSRQDEAALLVEELALIETRGKELGESLESLRGEEKEASEQKASFSAELNKRLAELNELRGSLRAKRDEQEKLDGRLIRLKARRDDLEERTGKLESSLPDLRIRLERLETGLRTFQRDNEKFYDLQKRNEEKLTVLNGEISASEKELSDRDAELRTLRGDKNRADAELSKLSARLDVLNDAEKHFSGMNRGSQFLAQSVEKGTLEGPVRSLQSLLDVPGEYEVPVAAALGDELDAVVLDTGQWERAMDLLNKAQSGRAVLFPEQPDPEMKSQIIHNELSGVKPLNSIVKYSDENAAAAQRALAGIWLAESREQAAALQKQLEPGQRIVTMAGDLFRADGSVVSGNEGKQKLLSRTREIRELTAEKDRSSEISKNISEKIIDAEKKAAALREDLKARQADRARLQSSGVDLQKKISQLSIEKEKQTQAAAYQKQRLTEAEAQIEANRKQSGEISAQVTELENTREAMRAEVRDLQDKINKIQLSELQDQVQHWNVNCAVLKKSISETENRVRENQTAAEKNKQKQAQLTERIQAGEKSAEELDAQISSVKEKIDQENLQTAAIVEETAPVESALKAAEEQLQSDQKVFQEKQQLVVSTERMLAQAQVEVTRHDDRLEALKKRIEDDLGMVNFMYDEKIEGQNTLPLGEMVSVLPKVEILSENLEEQIQRLKNHLRRMGAVNPDAITEYAESSERYDFLKSQMADLKKADADLRLVIAELDRMMENAFLSTFDKVQGEFRNMFVRLFGGGSARLVLTDPNDVNSSGIEIEAKLPGHREQELSLLSGGERSLTSVALIFSLLRVSPTPFCVMDEVDAALDEANVGRFCDLLKELGSETQFLLITHNRNTVEASNVIYGITMSSDSTSQVVSLRLDEIRGDILK
ncbi:MAG: hypothetical protein IKP86_08775, partial [Anaerolineaceae bacterium]|nr:hypothetical protein [Anaerolineaceae bacterium]